MNFIFINFICIYLYIINGFNINTLKIEKTENIQNIKKFYKLIFKFLIIN